MRDSAERTHYSSDGVCAWAFSNVSDGDAGRARRDGGQNYTGLLDVNCVGEGGADATSARGSFSA